MKRITKLSARLPILFLSVCGLFSGCSEKLEPNPITYSQLLTGTEKKTWRLVTLEVIDGGDRSGVIPIQNALNSCRADDQYVFFADEGHKLEYHNGLSRCDNEEPELLFESTWALTNANATLEFEIPIFEGAILPYTIKNLTENSMTVEIYFDKIYADPINASYRFTFNSNSK